MNAFVNGTFDILHLGHIKLLNIAKSSVNPGGKLIVAIDSDSRVAEKKGPFRPINNVYFRRMMLLNVKAVDQVYIFNTDEELEDLVKINDIDIMFVGDDYKGKKVIGSEFAKKLNFVKRDDGYSTSATIENIINRR